MDKIIEAVVYNDFEIIYNVEINDLKSTNISLNEYVYSQSEREGSNIQNQYMKFENLSLLHAAAYFDSLESYIALENVTGLDFAVKDGKDLTPLHFAMYGGAVEVAMYIFSQIEKYDDKTSKWMELSKNDSKHGNEKLSLIRLAAHSSSIDLLKALIKNEWGKGQRVQDHVNEAINVSISKKNAECIMVLLPLLDTSGGTRMLTPLQQAIVSNQREAIPILLETKQDLEYTNHQGNTALSIACQFNMVDIVRLLCSKMDNIDIRNLTHGKFISAVHWLCATEDPEITEIMIKKGPNLSYTWNGKSGADYIDSLIHPNKIISILNILKDNGYPFIEKSHSGIEHFLTAFRCHIEVIEWYISNYPNVLSETIKLPKDTFTVRDYIINKKDQFDSLIKKYPQLF